MCCVTVFNFPGMSKDTSQVNPTLRWSASCGLRSPTALTECVTCCFLGLALCGIVWIQPHPCSKKRGFANQLMFNTSFNTSIAMTMLAGTSTQEIVSKRNGHLATICCQRQANLGPFRRHVFEATRPETLRPGELEHQLPGHPGWPYPPRRESAGGE